MFLLNTQLKVSTVLLLLLIIILPQSAKAFDINPAIKSAIIPGWGQISIDRNYGFAMMSGEVLLWSSYFYSVREQKLQDRQSYEYALKYAHVNPGDYSKDYMSNLGKYNSSGFEAGGYNDWVRKMALYYYTGNPEAIQQYIDEHSIKEDEAWAWDSSANRVKYKSMRYNIHELKNTAQVISGLVIANHLLSTIDILRLRNRWKNVRPSIQYNRNTTTLNLNLDF